MKISETLPQFDDGPALMILTGSEFSRFYVLYQGEIRLVDSIVLEKGDDGDQQGRYEGRGDGGIIIGRSPDPNKQDDLRKFLSQFKDKINEILLEESVTAIYLFAPSYISKDIIAQIPHEKADMVRATFLGNYADKHLFDLVKMIQGSLKDRSVSPRSAEAQKIYDKFPKEK